jgi:hypothetical protein
MSQLTATRTTTWSRTTASHTKRCPATRPVSMTPIGESMGEVATAPIDSPIGVIEPGRVAGQRFVWEAVVRDQVVVRVAVNWLMGEEHLDPAWHFGAEGERFEVEVRGDPDTFVTIKGWQPDTVAAGLERNPGIVVTAMHCVNSIPAVCAAAPGVRTYVDLPLVTGRAHPDLA